MNFSSHLVNVQKEVLDSLSKRKEELIAGIVSITKGVVDLLGTDHFDFWMKQLAEIGWSELPVTQRAVDQERLKWEKLVPNRSSLALALGKTLEALFTYWEEDDLCDMQGQYYYLKTIPSSELFCESEFGQIRGFGKPVEFGQTMIASIQDLKSKGIICSSKEKSLIA